MLDSQHMLILYQWFLLLWIKKEAEWQH